jgi:hypothetical protein
MATLSERLAYVLTFDTSSGVKSLNKFGDTADKELSKADKGFQKASASMAKFGAAAVAFSGVAGVGLFKLAQGASDARQNFQALEQVVGSVAAANIKDWADGAAQAIGVSSAKAVEAARTFAQLGEVANIDGSELEDFSTGLVKLAADFAAFADVSPEQALQDIRSGFSGSTEVLRKYGIFLTEANLKQELLTISGEKVTGTLSAQQRILATNSLLYSQGATMIGQFERESDSLVGQTAILKAELGNLANGIGNGLLPMFRSGVALAGDFAEKISNTSPEAQELTGKLAGISVAAIGGLGALSFAGGQLMKLRNRMTTVGTDGTRSLNKLGKAARGAGVALAAVAVAEVAFSVLNKVQDSAGKADRALQALTVSTKAYMDGTGDAGEALGDFGDQVSAISNEFRLSDVGNLFRSQVTLVGLGTDEFGQHMKAFEHEVDEAFGNVASQSPQQAQAVLDSWMEIAGGLDASSSQYREQIRLIEKYQGRLDLQTTSQGILTEEIDETTVATQSSSESLDRYNQSIADSAVVISEWSDAFEEVDSSIETTNTNLDDAKKAIQDWADGINDAAKDGAESFDTFEVDAETSLEDYTANLIQTASDVEDWQTNLVTIAELTSSDFAGHIASMGAGGAKLAAQLAEGGPDAQAAFDAYVLQAQTFNTNMETEFDKVGPGLQEAMQEAERVAFVEASLQLVTIPQKAKSIGEDYSNQFALGIEAGVERVRRAGQLIHNTALSAIGRNIGFGSSSSAPNFSGGSGGNPMFFHDGGHVTRNGAATPGLKNDEVPAVLQTGEYVMSRDEVGAAESSGPASGGVTVQLVGDIYGAPSDEFVAELAVKLNKYAGGMA